MQERLIEMVAAYLDSGVPLDDGVRHFLSSTFDVDGAHGFQAFMEDPDGSEQEMFLELALFPRLELRLALEGLLSEARFDAGAEIALTEALGQRFSELAFLYDEEAAAVAAPISPDSMGLFVKRLHLPQNAPEAVVDEAALRLSEAGKPLFLVMVREAKLIWCDASEAFVCNLLIGLGRGDADLSETASVAIATLGSWQRDGVLLDHFLKVRATLEVHAEKAKQFEKSLETLTMEALMMQGVSGPSHSEEALRKKLAIMDRIIMDGFGVMPKMAGPREVNLGHVSREDGMEGLLGLLGK